MSDVTQILQRVEKGDGKAAEELLPLVYEELRKLAAAKMANEQPGQTLQPTALVHDAWLRLVRTPEQSWQNRAHFFRTAAECMRRILIDNARRKQQLRHGGGQQRIPLDDLEVSDEFDPQQLLYINQLHLFTVMTMTGKIRVVQQEGDKQVIVQDGKSIKTETCTDTEKQKIQAQIMAYVNTAPPGFSAPATTGSTRADTVSTISKKK